MNCMPIAFSQLWHDFNFSSFLIIAITSIIEY